MNYYQLRMKLITEILEEKVKAIPAPECYDHTLIERRKNYKYARDLFGLSIRSLETVRDNLREEAGKR